MSSQNEAIAYWSEVYAATDMNRCGVTLEEFLADPYAALRSARTSAAWQNFHRVSVTNLVATVATINQTGDDIREHGIRQHEVHEKNVIHYQSRSSKEKNTGRDTGWETGRGTGRGTGGETGQGATILPFSNLNTGRGTGGETGRE